jgi:hypothetical protein
MAMEELNGRLDGLMTHNKTPARYSNVTLEGRNSISSRELVEIGRVSRKFDPRGSTH